MATASKENPSESRARLRRAARLCAVQALYQMEIGGLGATAVIREFRDHRFGAEGEGAEFVAADEDFFESLVAGVVERQAEVDPAMDALLADNWRLERLDATVRAILRVGGFELLYRKDVPARVVIDEYIDIANAFFEGSEPKFINAAFDRCARDARPDEF
ncbi:transcription antitermination factor NusB [Maricaulis maris]|jgi:transcription antitermination protein NusB|uniref:transcription antitermination factor NusB n=2 Tax=Maricaulis TaxID=74317 RepID=UPI0030C71784